MSDRTVHANLASGGQIVRYERAGKWYLEYADGTRGRLTVREAAERAVLPDSVWFMGRPGGQAFDAKVRAALHRREDAGSGFDR